MFLTQTGPQAWKKHRGRGYGNGNANFLNKHISKIYYIMLYTILYINILSLIIFLKVYLF